MEDLYKLIDAKEPAKIIEFIRSFNVSDLLFFHGSPHKTAKIYSIDDTEFY